MPTKAEIHKQWYIKLKADPERYAEYRRKRREYLREWREKNPDKIKEQNEKGREASIARNKEWRKANPERLREQGKRWNEANPGRAKERSKRWAKANPDRRREIARRSYEANLDKVKERSKDRYRADPNKRRELGKKWNETNRDKKRDIVRRRRIAKTMTEGSHTEIEWRALCSYYMDQCLCCGDVPDELTRDHVVPISKGGTDNIDNIQPLCRPCNSSKHTRIMDYRI